MKRYWIPVLVTLLFFSLTSIGFAATQIKDVEPSHWAYKNVKMLIDKGYLSLYEDSTFRGDRTVTRFQLAEVVAKILEKIDNGTLTVSAGDANDVRKLLVEFNKELVNIANKQNLFTNRLNEIANNQVVVKEDVAKSRDEILKLIDQLVQLKDLNNKLSTTNTTELAAVKNQIAQIEKKMADGLAFSITGIADLGTQLEEVKAKQAADAEGLKTVKEENAKLKEETTRLAGELAKATAVNDELKATNTKLQQDIEKLKDKDVKLIYFIIAGIVISAVIASQI